MDWIFFLICILLCVNMLIYSFRYSITPTPTSQKVLIDLFNMLPEMIKGEIAELGSGWGTVLLPLARHFPRCQVTGFEISPFPYLVSKIIATVLGVSHLIILRQDFFQISLSRFSLVVCYLYPGAMKKLKIKFENELNPDSYVLSHTFAIPDWKPLNMIRSDDLYKTPIYLYQVKTAFLGGQQLKESPEK